MLSDINQKYLKAQRNCQQQILDTLWFATLVCKFLSLHQIVEAYCRILDHFMSWDLYSANQSSSKGF